MYAQSIRPYAKRVWSRDTNLASLGHNTVQRIIIEYLWYNMNSIHSRTMVVSALQNKTPSITKEQDSQTLPYHLPTLYGTFPPAIVLRIF